MSKAELKIKIQIYCGDEIAMGPGKADLMEAIASEGSISAAGRKLHMSYRRCWLLVDTMNRCWSMPVVATSSEGARLTEFGEWLLAQYRNIQAALRTQGAMHWPELSRHLRDEPLAGQ